MKKNLTSETIKIVTRKKASSWYSCSLADTWQNYQCGTLL